MCCVCVDGLSPSLFCLSQVSHELSLYSDKHSSLSLSLSLTLSLSLSLTNIFSLSLLQNPELQRPALHPQSGIQWTALPPSTVRLSPSLPLSLYLSLSLPLSLSPSFPLSLSPSLVL